MDDITGNLNTAYSNRENKYFVKRMSYINKYLIEIKTLTLMLIQIVFK